MLALDVSFFVRHENFLHPKLGNLQKVSRESVHIYKTTSVSRYAVIHLFRVDMPIPRSSATCLRVSPLVRAIRTASRRNSSVSVS